MQRFFKTEHPTIDPSGYLQSNQSTTSYYEPATQDRHQCKDTKARTKWQVRVIV